MLDEVTVKARNMVFAYHNRAGHGSLELNSGSHPPRRPMTPIDDAPVHQHKPVTHSGVGSPGNHEFTQFLRFNFGDQPAVVIDDTNGRTERHGIASSASQGAQCSSL